MEWFMCVCPDNNHGHYPGLDRRSKNNFIFQASTCYTKDQILAVFNVEENGISIEKFGEICPALIQQKVANVCNGNVLQQNETESTRPSTAESESSVYVTFMYQKIFKHECI
jgi:hypothetical protein